MIYLLLFGKGLVSSFSIYLGSVLQGHPANLQRLPGGVWRHKPHSKRLLYGELEKRVQYMEPRSSMGHHATLTIMMIRIIGQKSISLQSLFLVFWLWVKR